MQSTCSFSFEPCNKVKDTELMSPCTWEIDLVVSTIVATRA